MDELIKAVYSSLSDLVANIQAAEDAGLEIYYTTGPDNSQQLSITSFEVKQKLDTSKTVSDVTAERAAVRGEAVAKS